MRRIPSIGLALSLWLGAASAHAQPLQQPPPRPDALMSAVTSEVIAVLRQDRAAGEQTDVPRLIEKKILPLFDFQRMTSMAVARGWRLASPAQQSALVAEFTQLLVRTYSASFGTYRGEDIDYMPLRIIAGETEVLVRSSVRRRGAEPLTIDYDMENTASGWKVYDVKIAGVSLVLTYRDAFAATVRAEGIDGLIRALVEKNRRRPPLEAAAGRIPS